MIELLPPGEARPDNPAWHDARRQGVTASEIAAILGLSPWQSAFSLYWSKTQDWRLEDNDLLAAGRRLEDTIAQWWFEEANSDQWGMRPAGLYAHKDRPWQLATPDRLLAGGCLGCDGNGSYTSGGRLRFECPDCGGSGGDLQAVLECKWVAHSWDGWGDPGTGEIPIYYRAQGLWQADVLGVDKVHIAALGPGGFRAYVVQRDEKDLKVMRAAGHTFHERLLAGEVPDVDGSMATLDTLKRLHPAAGDGDVEVPVVLAETYRRARALKKRAADITDRCEARIRLLLGSDYDRAVVGKKLVASRSIYDQSSDMAELDSLDTDRPVVDRLNPGRATTYL